MQPAIYCDATGSEAPCNRQWTATSHYNKSLIQPVFTPFTVFTFSGQSPCSSVIRGEAPPKKIHGTSAIVSTVLTSARHCSYNLYAPFVRGFCTIHKKNRMGLHLQTPMNKPIDRKRWRRWRGIKTRWYSVLYRGKNNSMCTKWSKSILIVSFLTFAISFFCRLFACWHIY